MDRKSIIPSSSPAETRRLAGQLAGKIIRQKSGDKAAVVALNGDLGAGKTVFAKGFARALKIKKTVNSPTFLIFKIYPLKNSSGFKSFIHVDAYRLKSAADLKILGFLKLLKDPKNIILIEWADNVKKIIPPDAIRLELRSGQKENERIINIENNIIPR